MKIVDLHVHSNKSDGSLTPTELVHYAVSKGLTAFALTDHDTIDGIDEALSTAANLPEESQITVIPGIEFSTKYEGRDVHIVGICIDHRNPAFQKHVLEFADTRVTRNKKMCANLQEAGIDISYEKLLLAFPDSVITRGHYAQYLKEHGYVTSTVEAFDRYLGDHCKYFVPREKVTPEQAIELILKAGGIPILAHPMLYHLSKTRLDALVAQLKEAGLVGIEAIYCTHNAADERFVRKLADKYQLCISGGSDYHGASKPGLDLATGYGKLVIPEEILTNLLKASPSGVSASKLSDSEVSASGTSHILFTDLDGTLLTSEKKVSDYTKAVLERFTKAGHRLALSSGRAIDSVMDVQTSLGLTFPNMYLIGYNGGEIYDCSKKKSILRTALTFEQVEIILTTAQEMGIHCHTYSDTHIVAREENEQLRYYKRAIHSPVLITPDILSVLDKPPCKCIAIELKERSRLEELRSVLNEKLGDEVTILFSSNYYLEFFSSYAGKGTAVEKLCQLLPIPLKQSLAIGDEENDISMLKAAGLGIAMKNAKEAVKKVADQITTDDNNHDGLAKTLETLEFLWEA